MNRERILGDKALAAVEHGRFGAKDGLIRQLLATCRYWKAEALNPSRVRVAKLQRLYTGLTTAEIWQDVAHVVPPGPIPMYSDEALKRLGESCKVEVQQASREWIAGWVDHRIRKGLTRPGDREHAIEAYTRSYLG